VFRNGVDLERFTPQDQADARQRLDAGGPHLPAVGNLVELKGHHIAIEAMSFPDARLFIVGEGEERKASRHWRHATMLPIA
jgi:glycosyltransferase involved in cell wall biosynthesis